MVDGRRDLQTFVEDTFLALETDVGGPFDETGDVALGLNILADAEIASSLFNKRIVRRLLGRRFLGS